MKNAPLVNGARRHSGNAAEMSIAYHFCTITTHPHFSALSHPTRKFIRIERRKHACGYYTDRPHLEATLRALLPLIIAQLAHGPGGRA